MTKNVAIASYVFVVRVNLEAHSVRNLNSKTGSAVNKSFYPNSNNYPEGLTFL